jgi:alkanesulfonate monooxygenase SsuD/methylene tetrahydromethanopterin reductase-like flavin-dependent oxidoreductase (luciferase family)
MKFGFTPTEGGLKYAESLEEVRLGEQAGFDSVWLEEHHLESQHYWGTPLTGLAGFATATERLTLGADVVVLPFYHPVRLVEDAQLLSIMSEGRFILGVGMGYREDEYRAYGVPIEGRGSRYGEALRLLRQLVSEEHVTFKGRYYRVDDLTIQPRWRAPIPIWAGGWGEQNLRRAAESADAWIPGPTANLERLLWCRDTYRRFRAEAGKALPAEEPLTRELVIAETDGQAREDAERYLLPNYRDEYGGGWGHPLIGAEGSRAADLDALAADRFIIGSPDTVIAGVRSYAERFGANHIVFRLSSKTTTHRFIMRELELLGERVLPAFPD